MLRRMGVLLLLGSLMAGCASVNVGQDFDLRTFENRVQVGKTERADVRRWLGDPVSTGQVVHADGSRLEKWMYYHGKGRLPGLSDARLKMLEVQFRKSGVVDNYQWSGETK
ncbi:MAG TPA: hypothetical protein VKA48_04415 [Gammaproteobacteria bacterium]|nr:hypothetical protein [Gammaproteobacteria bacterium]